MICQKELKNMTNKIKNIQALLLKYFNKNSWQQYIDSQKFGDCKFISYLVEQMCNQFKSVEIEYNFSKLAIKELNQKNDFGDMFGNHFLNQYNGQLYDFGKGTNTISGIYLLKQNKFDKYSISLTNTQKKNIIKKYQRIITPNMLSEKIKKQYIGILNNQPQYLYHATYRPLLAKIRKTGLGNTKRTFWDDSKPGVVYLADDPDIAESYAEENENCNEDWLDEIIIFKIPIIALDQSKLFVDKNVLIDTNNGEIPHTYEYHGIIPFDSLNIYQAESFENTYNSMFN